MWSAEKVTQGYLTQTGVVIALKEAMPNQRTETRVWSCSRSTKSVARHVRIERDIRHTSFPESSSRLECLLGHCHVAPTHAERDEAQNTERFPSEYCQDLSNSTITQ